MLEDIKSFFNRLTQRPPGASGQATGEIYSYPSSSSSNASMICVANQKGGCGKTTTSINLSAGLAKQGYRVLLIDIDPQAHSSLGIGIDVDELPLSVYDVFTKGVEITRTVVKTYIKGMDVIPSSSVLSGGQLEIADTIGREAILRNALYHGLQSGALDYDYVIFDCAPSLNLITINGFVAANLVLIPIQTHYFSLEGMKELFAIIKVVKERLNSAIDILGILPTLYDGRTKLNREILQQIREYFEDKVFRVSIRMNVKLAEASVSKQSIFDYAPESMGATDYAALTDEVIRLTGKLQKSDRYERRERTVQAS